MAGSKPSKKKEKSKSSKNIKDEVKEYFDSSEVKHRQISDIKYNTKFKTKKQKDLFNLILDNRVIFITGPAGTGKTLISLMAAIECLTKDKYNIGQISLTKPIIEAARSIGFLKGSPEEKTAPYFTSFYDNIEKLIGAKDTNFLKEHGLITETIINFIRGNTFGSQDVFGEPIGHMCILDETQNITVGELKTYISRLSIDSKMIILGDEDQQDVKLKPGELNGLQWAFEYLQDLPNIAHFKFDEDDIVREPLLIDIMKRFKRFEKF